MNRTKTATKITTESTANMTELVQRAEALEAAALELATAMKAARGTREIVRPAPADVATAELYERVRGALEDKPLTFRDLCTTLQVDASGENRVKSVIVRLQRDGHSMVNLGNGSRAIWWIDVHGRLGELARGVARTLSARK